VEFFWEHGKAMIAREEIEQKSLEFGIHVANVQRDYVFGWLLLAVYNATTLKNFLIFKGGNCFRKAYFPNTRFSSDLDFSTEIAIDPADVIAQFNLACSLVHENAGVDFELERSQIREQQQLDESRRVFDVRVYFKDFYGHADHITIKLSIDITEFDRIYLPVQQRMIIHPYSDQAECSGEIRCLKLEEMIANKLKCLLQRKHVPDVYDLVYSVFVNRDVAVDRAEVLTTFLRKTIYERSPGVARQLLLGLPLMALRAAWDRYIIAPLESVLDFEDALRRFEVIINELFAAVPAGERAAFAFFPSELRTPIIQAGADRRLMRMTYKGVAREIEPYSLVYKQRKDGHREEYFYAYDRTGGQKSGPGIKSFLNSEIGSLEVLEERFEPRYPIELSKAGETIGDGYFNAQRGSYTRRGSRLATLRHGWRYTVECLYCSRKFKRMRANTALKPHKDGYGNNCHGRRGSIVDRELI
jgi:predicted nucleotidyltransferase component of viral defense system